MAERTPFEAKWRLLARVGVRCYILISNVSGAVKVAPLQILQFPVVLPHKFQDAEKFNLQFSDFSEITETADKLRWLRYQKGLRQRDVADYAGIDRSTYVHYEEYGKDLYPPEHMEESRGFLRCRSIRFWMTTICFCEMVRAIRSRRSERNWG